MNPNLSVKNSALSLMLCKGIKVGGLDSSGKIMSISTGPMLLGVLCIGAGLPRLEALLRAESGGRLLIVPFGPSEALEVRARGPPGLGAGPVVFGVDSIEVVRVNRLEFCTFAAGRPLRLASLSPSRVWLFPATSRKAQEATEPEDLREEAEASSSLSTRLSPTLPLVCGGGIKVSPLSAFLDPLEALERG